MKKEKMKKEKKEMSGKRREWSDRTPLLKSKSHPHQHSSSSSSSSSDQNLSSSSSAVYLEMAAASASPADGDGVPARTVCRARAGLFDENGKLLGSYSSPIQIWKDGDCIEQFSMDIWHAVCAAAACSIANVAGEEVKGIGFAATCSLVAVDSEGSPVAAFWSGDSRRNIIVWMDHRAVEQAERINSRNSTVLQYCGGALSPEMQPPKLRTTDNLMIGSCAGRNAKASVGERKSARILVNGVQVEAFE